jgi:hypothetical protein
MKLLKVILEPFVRADGTLVAKVIGTAEIAVVATRPNKLTKGRKISAAHCVADPIKDGHITVATVHRAFGVNDVGSVLFVGIHKAP